MAGYAITEKAKAGKPHWAISRYVTSGLCDVGYFGLCVSLRRKSGRFVTACLMVVTLGAMDLPEERGSVLRQDESE